MTRPEGGYKKAHCKSFVQHYFEANGRKIRKNNIFLIKFITTIEFSIIILPCKILIVTGRGAGQGAKILKGTEDVSQNPNCSII